MLPSTEGTRLALVTRGLVDKPVGGVHRGSRSDPLCVSVSALPSPVIRKSGELQHVSAALCAVLVSLSQEVYD